MSPEQSSDDDSPLLPGINDPESSAIASPTSSSDGEPDPDEETIKLDQFLKLADVVGSGGEAKHLIRSGVVLVNGVTETRRGRKLRHGDVVNVHGEDYVIAATPD